MPKRRKGPATSIPPKPYSLRSGRVGFYGDVRKDSQLFTTIIISYLDRIDSPDITQDELDEILKNLYHTLTTEPGKLPHSIQQRLQLTLKKFPGMIQIPSKVDLQAMKGLPTGLPQEDQLTRLTHIVTTVQKESSQPIITTDHLILPDYWTALFTAISEADFARAEEQFKAIPKNDSILNALLKTHTKVYVLSVIKNCILAQQNSGILELQDGDIVITPEIFKVLIKDIATTLNNPFPFNISFGLPSHHAHRSEGLGFCIFNKTGVLLHHLAASTPSLKIVIIGFDVNSDDGVSSCLTDGVAHPPDTSHYDVHDSRSYPHPQTNALYEQFLDKGKKVEEGIILRTWHDYKYYSVDLGKISRQDNNRHPAIDFTIKKLKIEIDEAETSGRKIALLIPFGWDSHQDETALCGTSVNGRMMSPHTAKERRFNDEDLATFYKEICDLCQKHPLTIDKVYWGLEGGYDIKMREKQIKLMCQVIDTALKPDQTTSMSPTP